jgi:hypothetical protein
LEIEMTRLRMLAVCAVTAVGCADVADYDDPRQVPLEDDEYVSCTNLLRNGDFDYSPVAWQFQPADILTDERQLPSDHPFSASSGYYFAWLGGSNTAITKTASQFIDVPRVSTLKLSGKFFVAAVTTAGRVEDTVKLEILDVTGGRVLATVASFTNLNSIPDGVSFSWTDLRADLPSQLFSGTRVIFRITSVNDAANNTNFLFDSLELKPPGCL